METIAEQIETLESIPISRIVNFFRHCRHWHGYLKRNERAYLRGDLERMMGTSIEFPTRTEWVINRRDAVFLERMRPFLERGRCAVLVGLRTPARPATHARSGGLHGQEGAMIGPDLLARVTAEAVIPEQLLPYVRAVSGAEPRLMGDCVGLASESKLVLVGYPLHDPRDYERHGQGCQ